MLCLLLSLVFQQGENSLLPEAGWYPCFDLVRDRHILSVCWAHCSCSQSWWQHPCTAALPWKRWQICSCATWTPGNSSRTSEAGQHLRFCSQDQKSLGSRVLVEVLPMDKWQRRGHRDRVLGRHCRGKEWKTTKLILAIQREKREKELRKRIEISTKADKKLMLQVLITPRVLLAVHKDSPELTPLTKQLSWAFLRQLVSHYCCLIKVGGFFTPSQLQSVNPTHLLGYSLHKQWLCLTSRNSHFTHWIPQPGTQSDGLAVASAWKQQQLSSASSTPHSQGNQRLLEEL